MIIKTIKDECYGDYKKPSMLIAMPYCSGKCHKELGLSADMCQNETLKTMPDTNIPNTTIVQRYLSNPLTSAICFGGLEPLEQIHEVVDLIREFRKHTDDDVVIYTGFNADEHPVISFIDACKTKGLNNIIVKIGRYRPDLPPRYEEVLGVTLASNNQYAIKIN